MIPLYTVFEPSSATIAAPEAAHLMAKRHLLDTLVGSPRPGHMTGGYMRLGRSRWLMHLLLLTNNERHRWGSCSGSGLAVQQTAVTATAAAGGAQAGITP